MQRKLLTPSRLAAATALALGGLIAGPSVVPAQADCARASVWLYKSQQGKEYVYGPKACVGPENTYENGTAVGSGTQDDSYDPGTISGGGAIVWLPL